MKSYIITTLILILHLFAFSVLAQQKFKIHNLTFAGNSVLTSENLQKQINTKPKKKFEKLIFWEKYPDFILPDFENDIDRLKNHYRRNGFLNPRIWYKIDTLTNKNQLDIAILIEENTAVKFATVNFNFSEHDLDANLLATLKKKVLVQPDRRFIDEHIFKTEDNLIETLANLGYPFATVTHHIELKNDPRAATVQFSIDTGQKSFLENRYCWVIRLYLKNFSRNTFYFLKTVYLYNKKLIKPSRRYLKPDYFNMSSSKP